MTAAGFLLSWLTGFSYGRYLLLLPLLTTALAVGRTAPAVWKAAGFLAAVGIFVLFSFVLFDRFLLERAILLEAVTCLIAYAAVFTRRQFRS